MNSDDRSNLDSRYTQHDAYNNYISSEILIPDIKERNHRLKKDSTAKLLIMFVYIGVLIFVVAAMGIVYYRNTPSYKISRGFQNLVKEISQSRNPLAEKTGIEELMMMIAENGSHIAARINLTSESLPSRANTIGIDTDCSRDVQNQVMSAETSLSMMNYDFVHLNFYTDNEAFCFSVPELFLENMYIENKNVISQYNESFFAELTGLSDVEDFSLDFFPGKEELYRQDWKDMGAIMKRYASDFEACRSGMIMEKAEEGVYRVVLPGEETDRLLQHIMEYYESIYQTGVLEQWRKEYDRLIHADISMLLEINGKNRIENIKVEEPVRLLDGAVSINGSISFMGDSRSIDRVVGMLTTESAEQKEITISLQFLQTPAEDRYGSELYVEVLNEEDTSVGIKYTADSNAALDIIERKLSVRNETEKLDIVLEGSLDDIVRGESLAFDLEKMTFQWNGKELFKLTGDILVEPLRGEVARNVEKGTGFFKMTDKDWWAIVRGIDDKYGGLLQYR